jgi:hypothetical protein
MMVTITCPWREEDVAFPTVELAVLETAFTCPGCATSVALVEEPADPLALAA